jgi:hypothetical protein
MHFNVSSLSAKLPIVYGTHQRLQAVPCYDYTNLMMYFQESVYGGGNCDTDGGPCCRSPSPENNIKQGLHAAAAGWWPDAPYRPHHGAKLAAEKTAAGIAPGAHAAVSTAAGAKRPRLSQRLQRLP